MCTVKNLAPLDIANYCNVCFLSLSSSAGQAAARRAVNFYFEKYRKAGQTLEDR